MGAGGRSKRSRKWIPYLQRLATRMYMKYRYMFLLLLCAGGAFYYFDGASVLLCPDTPPECAEGGETAGEGRSGAYDGYTAQSQQGSLIDFSGLFSSLSTWGLVVYGPLLAFHLLWFVSVAQDESSLWKIVWGALIAVLCCLVALADRDGDGIRRKASVVLISIWGFRSSFFMLCRAALSRQSVNVMRDSGHHFLGHKQHFRTYLYIFLPQSILLSILLVPLVLCVSSPTSYITVTDVIAVLGWVVGFYIETRAELALLHFRRYHDNHLETLTSDLWKYSQHPHQFGFAIVWWSFFIGSLSYPFGSVESGYKLALLSLLSPVLLTAMLLSLSLRSMRATEIRNPRQEAYFQTTPRFVIDFPAMWADLQTGQFGVSPFA